MMPRGPMQVMSGRWAGRACTTKPPANPLDAEMTRFMECANRENNIAPVLKSAIAHLLFVTIHPFEDGNGRIARAIADWVLARSENFRAALLQHVGADSAGAESLFGHSGKHTERGSAPYWDWVQMGRSERAITSELRDETRKIGDRIHQTGEPLTNVRCPLHFGQILRPRKAHNPIPASKRLRPQHEP
jgi:hypothetical protein